ncbi:MAG TPA: hypothetical protein VFB06_29475 [Streptosporangiaceae bacterium]|nr:hypothetical protein [Streptosporangiaceae bacterium]
MSAGSGQAETSEDTAAQDAGEAARRPLDEALTLAAVRAVFDQWRIIENDGMYLAVRGGTVTLDGPQSLILPFIFSSSLEGLTEKLSLQEWLRRMTPEELEMAWRYGIDLMMTARAQDDAGEDGR